MMEDKLSKNYSKWAPFLYDNTLSWGKVALINSMQYAAWAYFYPGDRNSWLHMNAMNHTVLCILWCEITL